MACLSQKNPYPPYPLVEVQDGDTHKRSTFTLQYTVVFILRIYFYNRQFCDVVVYRLAAGSLSADSMCSLLRALFDSTWENTLDDKPMEMPSVSTAALAEVTQ